MVTHTATKAHAAAHAGQDPNLENPLLGPHTPEEYEALEAASPLRHEYHHGQVWAMAGASLNHARIVRNLGFALDRNLKSGTCELVVNDIRCVVEDGKSYYYPDAMVSCDEADLRDNRQFRCPKLIAEVLSDSTASTDWNVKLPAYAQIPCLKYLLLVSQTQVLVTFFEKQAEKWLMTLYRSLDDVIALPELNTEVIVRDLYDRVQFGVEDGRANS